MVDRDKQYPFMIAFLRKREIWPTAFSFLRRWLSGLKNSEIILSHTINQLHFDKQLFHNVTLDRNFMIQNTTDMPARSGCDLINTEALLGGYEWRHYIRTYQLLTQITTLLTRGNWLYTFLNWTVLLLTFTLSFISELWRRFAAIPACLLQS